MDFLIPDRLETNLPRISPKSLYRAKRPVQKLPSCSPTALCSFLLGPASGARSLAPLLAPLRVASRDVICAGGLLVLLASEESVELAALHHVAQLVDIFDRRSAKWAGILAARYPFYYTVRMVHMRLVTLELRDLVARLEVIVADGAGGCRGHLSGIVRRVLQSTDYFVDLAFALKLSRLLHLVAEVAICDWAADEEAAEEEKDEGAEEQEYDHENKPGGRITVVLAVVFIVEVDDVAPDGKSRVGKYQEGKQRECIRNDTPSITSNNP